MTKKLRKIQTEFFAACNALQPIAPRWAAILRSGVDTGPCDMPFDNLRVLNGAGELHGTYQLRLSQATTCMVGEAHKFNDLYELDCEPCVRFGYAIHYAATGRQMRECAYDSGPLFECGSAADSIHVLESMTTTILGFVKHYRKDHKTPLLPERCK